MSIMTRKILLLPLIAVVVLYSCKHRNNKIIGFWEGTFSDSVHNATQYLEIKKAGNEIRLVSDEPGEDWYEIPGEKVSFSNNSLHFERFWGMEIYEGKFLPGDSVIKGIKQIANKPDVSFTLKRISSKKLSYRIPRIDEDGNRVSRYYYTKPPQLEDGFLPYSLKEAGIDSTQIYKLVNKIISGEIPNIHSLLILKDNRLVLEEYFYNYSINIPHRLHSVSKSFTSALTGIAIDRNFIPDVNEPVWKYFMDRGTTKWVQEKYDVRVDHLLSMSAGLDWKGLTIGESNDDMDMYKSEDYFRYILNKNLKYTPGTNFCYNNGLSLMLGNIIEKSSGISVDNFAKENLFYDLAINNYSWEVSDNGITYTDSGLRMRPRDMLKFGHLYLNKGEWHNKQLISANWINYSTRQKMNAGPQDYGYHWWIRNYIVNNELVSSYYALGHGEQAIIVVPGMNMVVVMTAGNYMEPEHRPFEIMTDYILPSVSTGKLSESHSKGKNLNDYTGEYRINQEESIEIVLTDSSLFAIDPSGSILRLIPESASFFLIENMSREVGFATDNQGNIVAAEIFIDGQRVDNFYKIK